MVSLLTSFIFNKPVPFKPIHPLLSINPAILLTVFSKSLRSLLSPPKSNVLIYSTTCCEETKPSLLGFSKFDWVIGLSNSVTSPSLSMW